MFGLVMNQGAAQANDLDLDDSDGINTTTIAKRERDVEWLNEKRFGAETVAGHNRNFAKPEGLRAGNYVISPEAGALVVFDDNIFGTDAEKVADVRTELTPVARFGSQFGRHVLDFSLDGKLVNYAENTDQDFANIRGRASGALHFDHAHTLSAGVLSSLEHEERNSPSIPFSAAEPVAVLHNRAAAGITRDVGRLYGTISAAAESWDFNDARSISGSMLDLDPRDTKVYSTQLRAGYRMSPGYEIIGKVRGLKTDNVGDEGTNTSSLGWEALAGLAFETNPLLRWRILGGFGVRDYERAGVESLTTSLAEGEVQWLPTQRLTIYGTLTRRVNETGGPDGSSLVQTGLDIRADYEIYHNLLLNVGAMVREDQSISTGTAELVYGGRIGLEYYFSKNWLFTFVYEHDVRESESDSRDMHRNRFMVGAKLRF
ncbi:MAG: outer membrane beta-barrel protein [Hyphomicrobium sp.]